MNKRGQITIFVIIAIVLIVGVVTFFLLRGNLRFGGVPQEFEPIYNYYLSCIEDETKSGALILGQQGGYITLPEFEPGSEYRPFSSQLSFFGSNIPYWYYLSGNDVIKEQVPSKANMELQLNNYIAENIGKCDFSDFEEQGYVINIGEPSVSSRISDNKINLNINMPLTLSFGESSVSVSKHKLDVDSELGKFYDLALKIYDKEKQGMFLENYAVDVLRLYAPVDGVELTCAPKIWLKDEIDKDLKEALEANIQAVKLKGSYHSSDQEYFINSVGSNVDEDVQFLYSRDWPTRIEVWDSKNGILMAEPVGLQQGLGILGFCYVPYHYVYDINFPVLVQIFSVEEIFQFPVSVIIDKNVPREALPATHLQDPAPEICEYANQDVSVYTYDNELNPIDAKIQFNCLGQTCDIGETKQGKLVSKMPACVNAYILAKADGYALRKHLFSTNEEGTADILLNKLYNISVDFKINSQSTKDRAIISFESDENSQIIAWPEQKDIQLSEGFYNITVYSYKNSTITLPAVKREECAEVPKSGIGGLFGVTEEKCFDIDIPSQTLSNVISGGGKVQEYITEMQLERENLEVNVESVPIPSSADNLAESYSLLEVKPVYINFK